MGDRIEFGPGFVLEGSEIKKPDGTTMTDDELKEYYKKKEQKVCPTCGKVKGFCDCLDGDTEQ
jgi:hypothetical protein